MESGREEDHVPCLPPRPASLEFSVVIPDPRLTLTPEKSNTTLMQNNLQSPRRKGKTTKKVTFGTEVPVTQLPAKQDDSGYTKAAVSNEGACATRKKPYRVQTKRNKENKMFTEKPNVRLIRNSQDVPDIKSLKIISGSSDEEAQVVEEPVTKKRPSAPSLCTPEMCSSLKLAGLLEKAKRETADTTKMVNHLLETSKEHKNDLQRKTSRALNLGDEVVFKDLTSLDVNEEELRKKLAVRSSTTYRAPSPVEPVPSVLNFFTPPSHRELAAVNMNLPTHQPYSGLITVLPSNDIYKLTRKWYGSDLN